MAALFYSRVMRIPLVISYHTHLPSYGKNYLGFIPGIEEFAWFLLRFVHSRADLTLVTSPQMRDELTSNGIPVSMFGARESTPSGSTPNSSRTNGGARCLMATPTIS